MSSIQRHGAKQWRARWRDPDGRQRSKVFDLKGDAETFLTSIDHKKLVGEYVDPAAGKITVREWLETWRNLQVQHRESTRSQVESYFRLHVYEELGNRQLRSLQRSDVQSWVIGRSQVLAPSSVALVYNHFAAAMKDAVLDQKISRTPCVGIKLPERGVSEIVPPTVQQVEALADSIAGRYRAAVVLAAGAGLRLGEVFGLQLDRLDLPRRTVKVDQQLLTPSNGPAKLGPVKSRKITSRTIPLADVVVIELAQHLEKYPPVDGFVFTTELDRPVRRGTFQDAWRRAKRNATDAGTDVSDVRFHDLRHHYASALIRAGCSVKVVQANLGHASATETLDTYSHIWPDDDDRSREAIQAIWATTDGGAKAVQ